MPAYNPSAVFADTFQSGTTAAGMPGTISTGTFSVWFCAPLFDTRFSGGRFFELTISGGVTLLITDGSDTRIFYSRTSPSALPSTGWIGVQLSFSIPDRTAQCYIQDQAVLLSCYAGDVGCLDPWRSTGSIANPGDSPWQVAPVPATGPTAAGIADVFFYPGHTIDLTSVTNRRRFINSDLSAVDLGSDGSGPFGSSPPVWLSSRDGTAADFLTNHGTGGSWTGSPTRCIRCDPGDAPPPDAVFTCDTRWNASSAPRYP